MEESIDLAINDHVVGYVRTFSGCVPAIATPECVPNLGGVPLFYSMPSYTFSYKGWTRLACFESPSASLNWLGCNRYFGLDFDAEHDDEWERIKMKIVKTRIATRSRS